MDYKRRGLSLEFEASVKESSCRKKGDIIHKYKRIIRQFPSAVDINRCEWEVKKDEVYILLRKKEKIDWDPITAEGGFDQLDSSEESPEEEGAAAAKPKSLTLQEFAAGFTSIVETDIPMPDQSGERQITKVVSTVFTRDFPHKVYLDEEHRRWDYRDKDRSKNSDSSDDDDHAEKSRTTDTGASDST